LFRDGFGGWLVEVGYSLDSTANLVHVMANLAKWMAGEGLEARELTAQAVERFAVYRRSAGYTCWCSPNGLARLVEYLRRSGTLPGESEPELSGADALVGDFGEWLARERHIGPVSVKRHLVWARQFTDQTLRGPDGEVVGRVEADDVEVFMTLAAAKWSPASMGVPAAAMRYFLAYLAAAGLCDRSLVDAVPKTRRLLRLGLPTAFAPETVSAVLTGGGGRPAGIRDAAVAALACDMGLRGSEIARLELDDIDWAHAAVTVAGKNGLREQMPLTGRAGAAVARWLSEGRRPVATRHVFHTVQAPLRPMTGLAASRAVRAAGRRAGVDGFTTRAARHSLGCAAVAGQGTVEDAGQLLRHQSAAATAIYARVDVAALAELAAPWPGAVS
jgi:integrase